jgi:hypothetical protein
MSAAWTSWNEERNRLRLGEVGAKRCKETVSVNTIEVGHVAERTLLHAAGKKVLGHSKNTVTDLYAGRRRILEFYARFRRKFA